MEITWTTMHSIVISDDDIDQIVEEAIKYRLDDDGIEGCIEEWARGLDDSDYYSWDESATKQLMKEIHKRMGGVQLSMFD